jgi:hypothetical protein
MIDSFGSPIGRLSIYNHFLEDQDAPADSHQNLGARFTGVRNLSGETSLVYTLEYAKQSDYKERISLMQIIVFSNWE